MRNHFYLRRVCGPLLLTLFLAFSLLPGTAQASSKIALNDPCYTVGITCNPPLIYHQGPVQHHPKIYLIFWGPKWTTADPTFVAINNLFTSLPGGAYNALLMQYYDTSDYVHNDVQVLGTWIDPQAPPASGIGVTNTTDSIYSEMINALNINLNWQVTEDAQFIVFPQAGTTINNGANECGRHEWLVVKHVNYYYSYVDTGGMKATCSGDPGSITAEVTHEYAETATDPQASSQYIANGSGWTTTDNNSGEIGDLCEASSYYVPYSQDTLGLYPTVQEQWDNYTLSCSSSVLNSGEYPAGGTNGKKHTVQSYINKTYTSGNYASLLGLPVNEQERIAGGLVSYFAKQVCNGGYKEPDGGQTSGSAIYSSIESGYNSPGETAFEVQGCIYHVYTTQMGGPAGKLGFPVSNEEVLAGGHVSYFSGTQCNGGYKVPDGSPSLLSGSAIFYNSGTYEVQGCIYSLYMNQIGGPASIGFPVSNEESFDGAPTSYFAGQGGKQCNGGYQVPDTGKLSGAAIIYTGNNTAYEVTGCIYTFYINQFSGPYGMLGFPVSSEEGIAGGRVSYFAGSSGTVCTGPGGNYIVPDTGQTSSAAIFYNGTPYEVHGCNYSTYMNLMGGPAGLGFPVSNEESIGQGRVSYFAGQGGKRCGTGYMVPDTKTLSGDGIFFYYYNTGYTVKGCIYNAYMNQFGGPTGLLGFPVSNEQTIPGGYVSYFTGPLCSRGGHTLPGGNVSGSAIFYNGIAYEVNGCIYDTYMGLGGPSSKLGFPISNEFSYDSAGDRQSTFQHGNIQWSKTTNLTTIHYS